jgi:hypothetical protein
LFLSHVVHKLLAYYIFYLSHLKILVYVLKRIVKFKKYVLVNKIKVILVNGTLKETIDFINVIGDRLIAESGDSKSKKFLFERISLAIQRGNAASIRGTFPDSALISEIFVL